MKNIKPLLNKIVGRFISLWYRLLLPNISGEFWITPRPKFLSQFIVTPPPNTKPTTLLTDEKLINQFGAKNAKEYTYWAWRCCGIACVKMILNTNKTLMQLANEGRALGGYDVPTDTGWYHQPLANLLTNNGVPSKTAKYQTAESVALQIKNNKPVIASVRKYSGHLFLVIGTKTSNGKVGGFWVHDPGFGQTHGSTWIDIKEFRKIFTGRAIL